MKKTILFCSYRDWASKIHQSLKEKYVNEIEFIHVGKNQKDKVEELAKQWGAETILFVGWSWIVSKKIIKKYDCVCLHPSKLPKYRGGSPIQHQIINGEKEGAITLFKMDGGVDTGDVLYQKEVSLDGELEDIFDRIVSEGIVGLCRIVNEVSLGGELLGFPQDESEATTFKRRKPEESEIKISKLDTAESVYNQIRALQYPYPNAFIEFEDGSKLYIKKSSFSKGKRDGTRTAMGGNKKSTPKKGKARTTRKLTS